MLTLRCIHGHLEIAHYKVDNPVQSSLLSSLMLT